MSNKIVSKFLEVTFFGNPVLREVAQPIAEVTDEIRQLAADMKKTMHENEIPGIGLAAPQIGRSLRLIVLDTRDPEEIIPANASAGEMLLNPIMPVALLNPKIVRTSEDGYALNEGCLSLPGIDGDVVRPSRLILQATILDGESITVDCGDMLARCVLHELDHLDGVLFIDRLAEEDINRQESALKKLKKQGIKQAKRLGHL